MQQVPTTTTPPRSAEKRVPATAAAIGMVDASTVLAALTRRLRANEK